MDCGWSIHICQIESVDRQNLFAEAHYSGRPLLVASDQFSWRLTLWLHRDHPIHKQNGRHGHTILESEHKYRQVDKLPRYGPHEVYHWSREVRR